MITLIYVKKNLFESPAQVLVNTVNTVGVMGKGIALQFKKLYPEMFQAYREYCESGQLTVGKLWIYKSPNKWILNFPTKKDWRQKSKIEYIEAGLKKFVETYESRGIESIAFPQLGVGNGGLNWEKEVKPLMEKYLRKLPIDVYIHIYNSRQNPPEFANVKSIRRWLDVEPQTLSTKEFVAEFLGTINAGDYDSVHKIYINKIDESTEPSVPLIMVKIRNRKEYALSQSDLTDFWMQLRDSGLVSALEYPPAIDEAKDIDFFENLMEKLSYVKKTAIEWHNHQISALTLDKTQLPQKPSIKNQVDPRAVIEAV